MQTKCIEIRMQNQLGQRSMLSWHASRYAWAQQQRSFSVKLNYFLIGTIKLQGQWGVHYLCRFHFQGDLDFTANNITSGGKYLRKIAKWASARNKPEGEAEHYDQAALLTRFVAAGNSRLICNMRGRPRGREEGEGEVKFSSPKRNGMGLAHMRDSSVSFTGTLITARVAVWGFLSLQKGEETTLNSVG